MTTPERLFTLDSDSRFGYSTGRLPDGMQLLTQGVQDGYAILYFTPDGDLSGSEEVLVHAEDSKKSLGGLTSQQGVHPSFVLLAEWRRQRGYQPGPIQVKKFVADEPVPAWIEELSRTLSSYLEEREYYTDPNERAEMDLMLKQWLDQECFAFYCNYKEYLLHKDGSQAD